MANKWTITQIGIKALSGTFCATAREHDDSGDETARIEFESKSLTRLVKMMEPLNAENM